MVEIEGGRGADPCPGEIEENAGGGGPYPRPVVEIVGGG